MLKKMAKAQVQNEKSKQLESFSNKTERSITKKHSVKKCCDLCTCACPNYVKKEAEVKLCPLFTQGCKIKGDGEGVELVPLLAKRKRPVTRSGKPNYGQLCCLQKFLLHIH